MPRIRLAVFVSFLLLPIGLLASNIKSIYGYVEPVILLPSHTTIQAKLDTGAGISSLSAQNIILHQEKNTTQTLSFDVIDKKNKIHYSHLPITGHIKIKNRSDEIHNSAKANPGSTSRPIVDLHACFDGQPVTLHVNLTDRSHFLYPLLIGRKDLIPLQAIVDPSQKNLANSKCTEPKPLAKEESSTQ